MDLVTTKNKENEKRQKRLNLDKFNTLQKMCDQALKDYKVLEGEMKYNSTEINFSLLQSRVKVIRRIKCEMEEVAKLLNDLNSSTSRKQSLPTSNEINLFYNESLDTDRKRKSIICRQFAGIPECPADEISPTGSFVKHPLDSFKESKISYYNFINGASTPNATPLPILAFDDFEFGSDEPRSESPFDDIKKLVPHVAHMSVFFNYLISNSNPSPFCLYFITSNLKLLPRRKKKKTFQFLCSVFCTFMQENAPLQVDLNENLVKRIDLLLKSANKVKEVDDLILSINQGSLFQVQELLEDFKQKLTLGLGSLFGDHDLNVNMDTNKKMNVVERSLWKHFQNFMKDSWNSHSLCMASCIATFFKMIGFVPSLTSDAKLLELCPIFRQIKKQSFSSSVFPSLNSKLKVCLIKDHHFIIPCYMGDIMCSHCNEMLCSTGNYGYKCTDCQKNFHKACVNLLTSNCTAPKKKGRNVESNIFSTVPEILNTEKLTGLSLVTNSKFKTIQHLNANPCPGNQKTGEKDKNNLNESFLNCGSTSTYQDDSVFEDDPHDDIMRPCPFPKEDLVKKPSLTQLIKQNDDEDVNEVRRQFAIQELISTQADHVRFLKILHNVLYIPMYNTFSKEFVMFIFPNLPNVIKFHDELNEDFLKLGQNKNSDFLEQLSKILVNNFCERKGKIGMEVFAVFLERQSHALKYLKVKKATDPKLAALIHDGRSHPLCNRLSLTDMLPCIMQRISKYPMLIKNILKYSKNAKSATITTLENVLRATEEMVSFINKSIKDFEGQLRLHRLQKSLIVKPFNQYSTSFPFLDEYRSLKLSDHKHVHDGILKLKVGHNRIVPVHIVLLEDMLVILQRQQQQSGSFLDTMTKSNNHKSATYNLILSYYSHDDPKIIHYPIIPFSAENYVKSVANDPRAFFLISMFKTGAHINHLIAETVQEKEEWCKHLATAIKSNVDQKHQGSFYFGFETKRYKNMQAKLEKFDPSLFDSMINSDIIENKNTAGGRPILTKQQPTTPKLLSDETDSCTKITPLESNKYGSMAPPTDFTSLPADNKHSTQSLGNGSKREIIVKSLNTLNNLENSTVSSDVISSICNEFNKFMSALKDFATDEGSASVNSCMSPEQLINWNNKLYSKLNEILDFLKDGENCSQRNTMKSFSHEVTAL